MVFKVFLATDNGAGEAQEVADAVEHLIQRYPTIQNNLVLIQHEEPLPVEEALAVAAHLKQKVAEDGNPLYRTMYVTGQDRALPSFQFVDWLVWQGSLTSFPGYPVDEMWAEIYEAEDTQAAITFRFPVPQLFVTAASSDLHQDLVNFIRVSPHPWRLLNTTKAAAKVILFEDKPSDKQLDLDLEPGEKEEANES